MLQIRLVFFSRFLISLGLLVMVAGADPYAWKGTVSANLPYLRAEAPDARVDQ